MTLASKITLVRIAFIPLFMSFMYLSAGTPGLWMWLSLAVFIIASLTDYIDGDHYFKTKYEDHNLVRARTQIKLAADMQNKWEDMNRIVAEVAAQVRK